MSFDVFPFLCFLKMFWIYWTCRQPKGAEKTEIGVVVFNYYFHRRSFTYIFCFSRKSSQVLHRWNFRCQMLELIYQGICSGAFYLNCLSLGIPWSYCSVRMRMMVYRLFVVPMSFKKHGSYLSYCHKGLENPAIQSQYVILLYMLCMLDKSL